MLFPRVQPFSQRSQIGGRFITPEAHSMSENLSLGLIFTLFAFMPPSLKNRFVSENKKTFLSPLQPPLGISKQTFECRRNWTLNHSEPGAGGMRVGAARPGSLPIGKSKQ